ncbi:MAG: DUF523 domain-containing protein [Alcanivoracaceae bacterium]|nr:DUF523 domain-containing protein [Alcanivoracaceae bacterium]
MIVQWLNNLGLPPDPHDKPRVGVSACLLGDAVRYDGDHKCDSLVSDVLSPWFEAVRLCPEVAIGLPVPRPPIQVVQLDGEQRVRRVDDPSLEYGDALRDHAASQDAALDGFILKARSPSCGVGTTPVHDANGEELHARGNGAFADALLDRGLAAPVVNESHLMTPPAQQLFLLQIHLHRAWRTGQTVPRAQWQHACSALPAPVAQQLGSWLDRLMHTDGTGPVLQSPQATSGAP